MSHLREARAEALGVRERLRTYRAEHVGPSVHAELWQGAARQGAGDLTCLFVGRGHDSGHLQRLLFESDTPRSVEALGSAPAWRLASLVRRYEGAAELVIVEAPWPQTWALGRGYLAMPAWVTQAIHIDDDWERNLANMTTDGRASIARVHRQGLRARLVQGDAAAADRFYDELYVPHARARFGATATLDERHVVRSLCSRFGLFEITKDEAPLAACVLRTRGSRLCGLWDGFRPGLPSALSTAVVSSVYYFNLLFGYEQGFRRLDLGGSRGFCRDGVLRYKRKWGAHIEAPDEPRRLCFRARAWSPGVVGFFAQNPVLRPGRRGFAARVLWPGPPLDAKQLQRVIGDHAAPGIERLEVFCEGGHSADALRLAVSGPQVHLEDLSRSRDPARAYCTV